MPDSIEELRDIINNLDALIEARTKPKAFEIATLIRNRAAEILSSKTHGTGLTAKNIRVVEEAEYHQYAVTSFGNPNRPAMLPQWLEYGTKFMSPRAYMRPVGWCSPRWAASQMPSRKHTG